MPESPSDLPLHAQIAEGIREQIASGELPPGERLPSEAQLVKTWNAGRTTVRAALEQLRAEGLIVARHGSGRYVRERPAVQIRKPRYRRARPDESGSPFARDAEREGARPQWTSETVRVASTEQVAARLHIKPGSYVMRTVYSYFADGRPVQESTSYEPFELVGGTPIEEPEGPDRLTGVVARFDSIGVDIDRVVELVQARPATPHERLVLAVPDEVWVQQVQRTYWAGEIPVETADIVIPADRYLLEYEFPIPPAEGTA